MPKEYDILFRRAASIVTTLEEWLTAHDGSSGRLYLNKLDRMRLLKFESWSLRYHVPVVEILDIVIPIVRANLRGRRKGFGLGVRVTALTGQKAESTLRRGLRERYPNHEQYSIWVSDLQRQQLDAEDIDDLDGNVPRSKAVPNVLQFKSVEEYVKQYRKAMGKARERYSDKVSARWRLRKPYRGNPWL